MMSKKRTILKNKRNRQEAEPPVKVVVPPALPNEDAEPRVVYVQLRDVQQTEVGSICPACSTVINAVLPQQTIVVLKSGQQVDVQCGQCGQPMLLEYKGQRSILTPDEDIALRLRGR